jgi:hypothetical protein
MIDTSLLFADAFATYLLSSSGCMVDLDTTEVIMNHAVVSAEDSDDPNIHIYVVGGGDDKHAILKEHAVDEFPITLMLQVLTKPNPNVFPSTCNYQYIMDVAGKAHFPKGSCEGKKRIAGNLAEKMEVVIEEPGAVVWAGWACAHEAVRLIPAMEFTQMAVELEVVPEIEAVAPQEPDAVPVAVADAQADWSTFLLSDAGCGAVQLSDINLAVIQNHLVEHDAQHALSVVSGTSESIPAELKLSLDAAYDVVVLETSAGANFAPKDGVGSACGGQRVAVAHGEAWPKLTIHEDKDIRVWAVYSVAGGDSSTKILYKTSHLKLEYEASSTQPKVPAEAAGQEDPKGGKKEDFAGILEAQRKLKDDPRSREHRGRPAKRADRQMQKDELVAAREQRTRDSEKKNRIRNHGGVEQTKTERRDALLAKIQKDRLPGGAASSTAALLQRSGRGVAREAGTVGAAGSLPKTAAGAAGSLPETDPAGVFYVGSSYYMGMAILVVANALAIQLCLVMSQRKKGRRDM